MAITDLSSLKAAINVWADLGGSLDDQLDDVVQMTTHMLNFGSEEMMPLRVREMESVTTLSPTSGVFALPSDYLRYRRVVELGSTRNKVEYIAPAVADDLYPDRASGLSRNFTIIGSSLYLFPLTSNDVELQYYQKIPELIDASDTNWLLTAHPAVYLHGSLFNIGMINQWDNLMSRSAGLFRSLASGLMGTDEMANYAYAPTQTSGITVV